jgi:glycerol uptake facilitator-like aquaporin
VGWPPSPGSGPYPLPLNTPGFYVLVLLLAAFVGMLWVLQHYYPARKRALQGFFEAAGIDLAFLVLGVLVVVGVAAHDPSGNRTSRALYDVVLSGYWLTFSIPVVTVGSSVEARSRGSAAWMIPSLAACGVLFLILFGYYFGHP